MKGYYLGFILLLFSYWRVGAENHIIANRTDSVYLFSYCSEKNNDKDGLQFAWSSDGNKWFTIGSNFGFVKSDYGSWGKEKRMLNPYLTYSKGMWRCVWSVNEYEPVFAYTESKDLIHWKPQDYYTIDGAICQYPMIVTFDDNQFAVRYMNGAIGCEIKTSDFKTYAAPNFIQEKNFSLNRARVTLPTGTYTGQIHRVEWTQVEMLKDAYDLNQYRISQNGESAKDDAKRFDGLDSLMANVILCPDKTKAISDMLIGVFFEDINYAADGGLYAELIQNRDFEYTSQDIKNRNKWNATYAWSVQGNIDLSIAETEPIHQNNRHYGVIEVRGKDAALKNGGYDGIVLKKAEKYDFSCYIKQLEGSPSKVNVRLVSSDKVIAQSVIKATKDWKQNRLVLTASASAENAHLELQPVNTGKYAFDMVSLFPQKTFKGRKNGLRADLAQTIADIHPRFVRFPGGCVSHGDGLDNIYRWKNTIGALESRVPMRNLWSYHQTMGLGYYEYFQFCEDINAEPLPVIAAGVSCQNSSTGGAGQQGGVPIQEMGQYIQDILDLVEWANGDAKTSKWGKLRAEQGHPMPFNLKYIGIGNEDLISEVFAERYLMICKAVKEKYPNITVVGTVGPWCEGSDYETGWKLAMDNRIDMVDEHYYQSPGWFINNQDYYDKYRRGATKVYLGEYASHIPGRISNMETALSEAIYLLSVERNADVVAMTSYAPLLAKQKHTQWNPDLIYFNNKEVLPTVNYYVQKLFGCNSGDVYISTSMSIDTNFDAALKRVSYSVVKDSKSGDIIVKAVNLLPKSVTTAFDFKGMIADNVKADKSIISGQATDRDVKPISRQITVSNIFQYEMPAYSFTVIRIPAIKK